MIFIIPYNHNSFIKFIVDQHYLTKNPIYYDFDCILNVIYNNKIKKIKLDYDLRKLLPNNEFRFSFNIKSISKFDELSFSLERDNQVINLSNSNKNGNLVILCTK